MDIKTTCSSTVLSSLVDAIQAKPAALPVRHSLRSAVILSAPVLLVSIIATMALVTTLTTVLHSPVKMVPSVWTTSATTVAFVWQATLAAIVQMKLMNAAQNHVRMVQIVLTFLTALTVVVRMDSLVRDVKR